MQRIIIIKKNRIVSLFAPILLCLQLHAQSNFLDTSFGENGFTVPTLTGIHDLALGTALEIQPDGRIITAGIVKKDAAFNFQIGLFRCLEDGSPDYSFGDSGWVLTDLAGSAEIHTIALQLDGKILVSGSITSGSEKDFLVIRYESDGSLDQTFGNSGIAEIDFNGSLDVGRAMVITPTGFILVAGKSAHSGNSNFALACLTPNGLLHMAFGNEGKITLDLTNEETLESIQLLQDQSILVGGSSSGKITLLKLTSSGLTDTTFADQGILLTSCTPYSMDQLGDFLIQPDGKIRVAGTTFTPADSSNKQIVVYGFLPNGTPDTTFGTNGIYLTNFAPGSDYQAEAISQNFSEDFFVAGYSKSNDNFDLLLLKLDASGQPVLSFGNGGSIILDYNGQKDILMDLKLDEHDAPVVAGYVMSGSTGNFLISRFENDQLALQEVLPTDN